MRPHLVTESLAIAGCLATAIALAAPPGGPHADHAGPPGSARGPDGKPGFKAGDGRPGKPGDGPDERGHGRPAPSGSAFPAPSGSGPHGHFGRERGDAGAPRERSERARDHRLHERERMRHMFRGGPPPQGLADEMKRHAHRVARIERARQVAEQAKDTEGVARAEKLLTKENERHERWLSKQTAAPAPSAAPSAAAPAGSAP
ncbi:MAG: hypothetical protein QM756_47085 [Polyangiaceae bacterium]